jgi:hypothetical protein
MVERSAARRHSAIALVVVAMANGCAALLDIGDLPPAIDGPSEGGRADADMPEADAARVDAEASTEDVDTAPPLPGCGADTNCRVVFITSIPFVGGSLQDLSGGDVKCQEAAARSGASSVRGHTFKAWLSNTGTHAVDRISQTSSTKRFVRPDGVAIANNVSDLIDGSLLARLQLDENGRVHDAETWTGTTSTGQRTDDEGVAGKGTCASWTSTSAFGTVGHSTDVDGRWTNVNAFSACTIQRHLYCFED